MRPLYTLNFATAVLCAIVCWNVLVLSSYLVFRDTASSEHQYSYVGDDFPEHWPLPPANPVALVVEDPIHLPITGPDAREEWASYTPKGFGYLRLGPEHRAFTITMFHEYHCLRLFRFALAGDTRPRTRSHFAHCLNYIRQMVLCAPDLTLEPYDALERNFDVERSGATHVCEDWNQVYDEMSKNWEDWVKIRPAPVRSNLTVA
ncbi:hypothetical protein C8Q76DRAFT_691264 [Earliella scabrosa]|nr:hypothetical protein C8Q76DRAFT_691264 [Earliella scabrosa]